MCVCVCERERERERERGESFIRNFPERGSRAALDNADRVVALIL